MFYKVPKNIFSPVANRDLISGSVLVVNDSERELANQISKIETKEVYTSTLDQIVDYDFWKKHVEVDWVVGITQGLKDKTEWVTDCGLSVAKKGICILDRLTFLEPTRQRAAVLESQTLKNIIILSPRPSFRADSKKLKDSVTSAWFIFSKEKTTSQETKIDFDINWDRPKLSC